MVREEHPLGREILRILLEHNLIPSVIIQDVSTIGDLEREKFLKRFAGQLVRSRLTGLAGKRYHFIALPITTTISTKKYLKTNKPEILVLAESELSHYKFVNQPAAGRFSHFTDESSYPSKGCTINGH